MSTRRLTLAFAAFSAIASITFAADWAQWRGPQRSGVSIETGLADQWPASGPRLVWQANTVGDGYGSASVVGNRIYITGNEGLENEYVYALDAANGREVWKQRIGNVGNPNQEPPYPAAPIITHC